MAVIYAGGAAHPSLALGPLGGGSALCSSCLRCLRSCTVLAVVEVGVACVPAIFCFYFEWGLLVLESLLGVMGPVLLAHLRWYS